jgi:NIPSNAP
MKNLLSALAITLIFASCKTGSHREFYSLTLYRTDSASQEAVVDAYLAKALIPALHRSGISSVGVFKPAQQDTLAVGKETWVLVPYQSLAEFHRINASLGADSAYTGDGKDYLDAPHDRPPYSRMEITLMEAFTGMPSMERPTLTGPREQRIYELRSYEGPTEKLYRSKVKMFNTGDEIGLFRSLGFNSVFFAEVLAGSSMPNLLYMTTFDDFTSREEHWKAFFSHPHWKQLLTIDEYKNTVSKADIHLLRPADYSDY